MEMIALTTKGDTKYTFNPNDPSDVEQARVVFREYRQNGYSAVHVRDEGNVSLQEFDPAAGTIMFIPLMVGG